MARAGHAELLNSLMRAALSADGTMLLSAAGVDATRPIDDQADAFLGGTARAIARSPPP